MVKVSRRIWAQVYRLLRDADIDYSPNSPTAQLEREFAAHVGARYCVAASTGSAALLAAYRAIPKGEVIVAGYGFWATAASIIAAGSTPVFCDVDPTTGTIDVHRAESLISPRTVAIAVTHVYGIPADLDDLVALCRAKGLYLIEDCSHAHGAIYRGRPVGSIGHIGIWSLQAKKTIPAGEGGLLVTNDGEVFARACAVINPRRLEWEPEVPPLPGLEKTGWGVKLRMNPLGAALALVYLREAEKFLPRISEAMDYFGSKLRRTGLMPLDTRCRDRWCCSRGGYYEYAARCPDGRLRDRLRASGLLLPSNTGPFYRLPLFASHNLVKLPMADMLGEEVVHFPIFRSKAQARRYLRQILFILPD